MKRKYKRSMLYLPFLFCAVLCFCIGLFSFLEKQFLPSLKEISHMQCKIAANDIINHAILKNLQNTDTSSLLLHINDGYTANTALINSFCAALSADITSQLEELSPESIQIPLGAATNLSFFANAGPKIPFTLLPMGSAKTDYETEFISTGINQINYKIWLNISMELKIVNPFYQETIQMERKIMLADLIYSGKVPEHYFQVNPKNEYLLTE